MANYNSLNSSGMTLEQSSQSINSSGLSHNASTVYSPNNSGSPRVGTMVPNRIFVGGIQAGTVEHELRSFFEVHGVVKDVKIIKDPNGTSKGFGFVTYENEDDAKRVQEMASAASETGLEFKGRRLNVGPAIKKQNPYPPKAFDVFGSTGMAPSPVFYSANGVPYTYSSGITLIPTADGGYAAVAQQTPQYAYVQPQTGVVYVAAGGQQGGYSQATLMAAPSQAGVQVQTISAMNAASNSNGGQTQQTNTGGFTIAQSAPNQYSISAAQNGQLRYATQMTSAYGPYVYQTSPTYSGEMMSYAQLAASQGLTNQAEMQEYLAYDMEALKSACPTPYPLTAGSGVGCMPMSSHIGADLLPNNPLIDRPCGQTDHTYDQMQMAMEGFNEMFGPLGDFRPPTNPPNLRLASVSSDVPSEPNHSAPPAPIEEDKENDSSPKDHYSTPPSSKKSGGKLKTRVSPQNRNRTPGSYTDRYTKGFENHFEIIRRPETSKEPMWNRDGRMATSLPNSPNQFPMRSFENRRWGNAAANNNNSANTSAMLSILNQKSPRKAQLQYTGTTMAPRYSSTPQRGMGIHQGNGGMLKSINGELIIAGCDGMSDVNSAVTPPPTPISHDYQQH